MAKKKIMFGEELDMNKIPVTEIEVGRTYLTYVGNLVKVISYNEESDLMKVYNISEACHNYLDRKNAFFVKFIR